MLRSSRSPLRPPAGALILLVVLGMAAAPAARSDDAPPEARPDVPERPDPPPPPSEDAPPALYDEDIPRRQDGIVYVIDAASPSLERLKDELCRSIDALGPEFQVRIHVLGPSVRTWREKAVTADAAAKAAAKEFVRAVAPAPREGTIVFLGGRTLGGASGADEGADFLAAQREAPLLRELDAAFAALVAAESPLRKSKLLAAREALAAIGSDDRGGSALQVLTTLRAVRSRAGVALLLGALLRINRGEHWVSHGTGALARAFTLLTGQPYALAAERASEARDYAARRARAWLSERDTLPVELERMPPERLAAVASALLDDVEGREGALDLGRRFEAGPGNPGAHVIDAGELIGALGALATAPDLAARALVDADLSPALVPALLELAREPAHLVSAGATLALLRRRGDGAALDATICAKAAHPAERLAALTALWAAGEKIPAGPLVSIVRGERRRELRLTAIRLLGETRDAAADALAALRALAEDASSETRLMAALALARLDPAAGAAALDAVLRQPLERDREREALQALASLRSPPARDAIGDHLERLLEAPGGYDAPRGSDAIDALGAIAGRRFGSGQDRASAEAALAWWHAQLRDEDRPGVRPKER